MKFVLSLVSAFAIYASTASAETATQFNSDKLSCEALSGQYTSGYCLVSLDDIQVPQDTKWVSDKDGTLYTIVNVDGKDVVVYDGFLQRRIDAAAVIEILIDLLTPEKTGCSGRYTC